MFNLFNLSHTELDSKLNDLSSQVQQAQSAFYTATKNDWDAIFELCKKIADEFKNVRYPSKSERDVAWQKFISSRNQAFEIRRNQAENRSKKYYDEIMSRLQSVDYDRLADFLVGEVLSFGLMKIKADDMKSAGRDLRKIVDYFKSIKYEMTREHSAEIQSRIIQVREHHNDFWGRYNSYQVEKQKAWEEHKKAKEQKQKEWEARQQEREQKKKEWEARQQERERKQKEWEARKSERERKQREWEARQADYQRERERKQREYEERKAENERKKREWEERKANRGSGGRKKGGGGGCYITTAVCNTLGKPDDCEELTAIRSFRDNWLLYQKLGHEIVEKYYNNAPKIVLSIDSKIGSIEIYKEIWTKYLSIFFLRIKEGQNRAALKIYQKMVEELELTYLK